MFTLDEVRGFAKELQIPCVIPLVKVTKAKLKPTEVYAALREKSKPSFLLESAIVGEKIARYSFLGGNPDKIIRIKDGILSVNGEESKLEGNPASALREVIGNCNVYKDNLPKFFGGLLGYFSYDTVRYFEDIGDSTKDDLDHDDARFMFIKDLVVFDHWRGEMQLVSNLIIDEESKIPTLSLTA